MSKSVLYLIILCFIISCNNSTSDQENTFVEEYETDARLIDQFKKTFEGVNLPIFSRSIKTNESIKIETETGAEINIPENAFIDKNGDDIAGEVTIKYKEIKSPADIIIENIDMTYDSAGVTYQFQTAGMFDLRAYSGDEEVFLKKGKNIEVDYITTKSGNYNVYYYDKDGWNYQGISKEEVPLNADVIQKTNIIPLKPVATDPDNDLILDIKASHSNIPELSIYKKVLWKYDGDLSNEEVAKILSATVYQTSVVPGKVKGKYIYKFKTSKEEFELPVTPVFQPKAFKKAMEKYNDFVAQNTSQVQVKRKVKVSQLGLMNYDILYHRSDAVLAKVEFYIKDEKKTKVEGLPLFHITGEDDVVVNVGSKKEIYYSKNMNNKLVAIFPDKTVAVLGTKEFLEAVNRNNLKPEFELKKIDKEVKSPADLDDIISTL